MSFKQCRPTDLYVKLLLILVNIYKYIIIVPMSFMPNDVEFYNPKVQNVVGIFTLDIRQNLKLADIASRWSGARYNRLRFSGMIARNQQPRATFMIFSNGKVIVTGAKSEVECQLSIAKLIKKMNKFGVLNSLKPKDRLQITNIVGTVSTKLKINLEVMCSKLPKQCQFVPETFPGLIYKMKEPKVTILIFSNGKIVITGAKSENEIGASFRSIYKTIRKFRIPSQLIVQNH